MSSTSSAVNGSFSPPPVDSSLQSSESLPQQQQFAHSEMDHAAPIGNDYGTDTLLTDPSEFSDAESTSPLLDRQILTTNQTSIITDSLSSWQAARVAHRDLRAKALNGWVDGEGLLKLSGKLSSAEEKSLYLPIAGDTAEDFTLYANKEVSQNEKIISKSYIINEKKWLGQSSIQLARLKAAKGGNIFSTGLKKTGHALLLLAVAVDDLIVGLMRRIGIANNITAGATMLFRALGLILFPVWVVLAVGLAPAVALIAVICLGLRAIGKKIFSVIKPYSPQIASGLEIIGRTLALVAYWGTIASVVALAIVQPHVVFGVAIAAWVLKAAIGGSIALGLAIKYVWQGHCNIMDTKGPLDEERELRATVAHIAQEQGIKRVGNAATLGIITPKVDAANRALAQLNEVLKKEEATPGEISRAARAYKKASLAVLTDIYFYKFLEHEDGKKAAPKTAEKYNSFLDNHAAVIETYKKKTQQEIFSLANTSDFERIKKEAQEKIRKELVIEEASHQQTLTSSTVNATADGEDTGDSVNVQTKED